MGAILDLITKNVFESLTMLLPMDEQRSSRTDV